MNARLWYDEDPELDPTVHVRLVLHLRPRGQDTAIAEPVLSVQVDTRDVLYASARDGRGDQIPLTEVESGWVEIRPVPADQEHLRERYPAAYHLWQPASALQVLRWGRRRDELPVEWLVQRLHRPPAHLEAKYARLEELARAARDPGPRAEAAPHHRHEPRVDGEYLVSVFDVAAPRQVAARVGVQPKSVFDTSFCARLSDGQLAALRADPDVDYIGDNVIIKPR
jgi:hypothetical protein